MSEHQDSADLVHRRERVRKAVRVRRWRARRRWGWFVARHFRYRGQYPIEAVRLMVRADMVTPVTAPHPAQQYIDRHDAFPVEDRTDALLVEALGCVYSGAGELEAAALVDALDARGLRIEVGHGR